MGWEEWTTRLSKPLMFDLIAKFGLKIFVETGTNYGDTCKQIAKYFEQVYTVEINPNRMDVIKSNLQYLDNIVWECGDSVQFLKETVKYLIHPTLFWLDAHYSGPETSMGCTECPVLDELKAIGKYCGKDSLGHVIVIDDARMFFKEEQFGHDIKHWPHLDEIKEEILGFHYYIRQIDDAFVITPKEY